MNVSAFQLSPNGSLQRLKNECGSRLRVALKHGLDPMD